MKTNSLFESLLPRVQESMSSRRYSLAEMISESYKVLYNCEEDTNLKKLAESHLEAVREDPSDLDRLSENLSILKSLVDLTKSGELKDEDITISEDPVQKVEESVALPKGARRLRRREGCSPKEECDTPKKEDIDEAEEVDLTDEEVEELANHLEQIRKEKKLSKKEDVDEATDVCDHCGRFPCVCESKEAPLTERLNTGLRKGELEDIADRISAIIEEMEDRGLDSISLQSNTYGLSGDFLGIASRGYMRLPHEASELFDDEEDYYESKSEDLKEAADSTDYKVYSVSMDVAFPGSIIDGSYGVSAGSRRKLFIALTKALRDLGLEMAGDDIEIGDDLTDAYKSEGNEFFSESSEVKLEDNGELVDEESKDTVEPKAQKVDESLDEENPVIEEEAPQERTGYVVLKDVVDTWHTLNKYNVQPHEFREGEGVIVTVSDYQRLLQSSVNKGYVRSLVVQSMSESKSYDSISLRDFSKKSSGKAFFKTFKKMKDALSEGRALTRQESINLYKAANSAMTQLSVELEHNPEFLPVFNESVSLLSKDVTSILESMKRGKAPSKATMKSLAKFTESLLCEAEDTMTDAEMRDYWNKNKTSDPILAKYKSYDEWYKDSRASGFVNNREMNEDEDIDLEIDDEVVVDDEGDIQSEAEEEFDQEYADARVELHKELEAEHAGDEDPGVQEKLEQDAAEVVNLPGITDEQIAEIEGGESEGEEIAPEEAPAEEPESEDELTPEEDSQEVTDDELAELKRHLKEFRKAKLMKK